MKYRVIDTRTGNDITEEQRWILTPQGQLAYVGEFGNAITICGKVMAVPVAEDWNEV